MEQIKRACPENGEALFCSMVEAAEIEATLNLFFRHFDGFAGKMWVIKPQLMLSAKGSHFKYYQDHRMALIHHKKLPDHSTLLSGREPPDEIGFRSEQLQIWYNNTNESWVGDGEIPHMHTTSDECFIVLKGAIEVEVEGKRSIISEREFCCFPVGVYHAVTKVFPPVETLMLRAPSVEDKVYQVGPALA